MSSPANAVLRCPACGTKVTGRESECPRCGKKFDLSLKFECQYCGELILKGARVCPFCQLDVSGQVAQTRTQPTDKRLAVLMKDLVELEAGENSRKNMRFSCPKCSLLIVGTERNCPNCGTPLASTPELACPKCGSRVKREFEKCPICFTSLLPAPRVPEPAKVALPVAVPVIRPRPPEPPPPPPPPESEDTEEQSVCPRCGSPIGPGDEACAKCKVVSAKSAEQKKAAAPQEEETKSVETEKSLDTLYKIALGTKPTRIRRLRAGEVTKVSPRPSPRGNGLSNGVGQINGTSKVNGLGRTNGTGAVNGRSMVNGTGVSNGVKAGGNKGRGGFGFVTRWQFLTVLVVVVVVLSVFVVLSVSDNREPYSVDGDFGEWNKSVMYSASIQSDLASMNITEWSFATHQGDLYLYVRTLGNIMSSSDVESFFLFIDSDGSNNTGYTVSDIGADYMMEIYGWNGSVQSEAMCTRSSNTDRSDWNSWTEAGYLDVAIIGDRLEARADLSVDLAPSARLLLMSESAMDTGSVSHTVPTDGGLLVVRMEPSPSLTELGVVPATNPVTMLTLTFTCEGAGGRVNQAVPSAEGAPVLTSIGSFSLEPGQERVFLLNLDTSSVPAGEYVWASMERSGISSTFAEVEIVGPDACAYVETPPQNIIIDGAFADWSGKTYSDADQTPVQNPNLDIDRLGNVSTSSHSYFYISVEGEICKGSYAPASLSKPSGGGGGGGPVIPTKKTGEDFLRILIDSDRSTLTGYAISYQTNVIGADQMIEVVGFDGRIVSAKEYDYSSSVWVESTETVAAAKDLRQIEIGVSAASLGGGSNIDFIVETTSWKGTQDKADDSGIGARMLIESTPPLPGTESWIVDGSTTSAWATAMSYQRKMFYDGTNYWSLYFDGSNTVHKYSTDNGVTWTSSGSVFKTSGVNETSIWYDSANSVVYAVGDTSSASQNIYLQKGTVNAALHTIVWAASDSTLQASTSALVGKNTFISRDANGYLWVLSSNCSSTKPARYDLTAFKSTAVNSITSWSYSGQMLAAAASGDTVKGSIVPAGTGSDMWAIYTYAGTVASRKYTGNWQTPQTVILNGNNGENTENSPPSVVVDSGGVVHVVYGTGRKAGQLSIPSIEYAHNNTGSTAFSTAVDLDQWIPDNVGDKYPTISLDSATGDLLVFWLRTDTSGICKSVMGRKYSGSTWSNETFTSDTTYTKQYLTSIYSVSGYLKIAWQWTQNTTGTIQVHFDHKIPEFHGVAYPCAMVIAIVLLSRWPTRRRRLPQTDS